MRIVLTQRALRDIANIRDYLLEKRPSGAENVRLAIAGSIGQLGRFPRLGTYRSHLKLMALGVPATRTPSTIDCSPISSKSFMSATTGASR
jgi:plasmid stabilization system protein ParE